MLYIKNDLPLNPTEKDLDDYYEKNLERLFLIDKTAAKKKTKLHRIIEEKTKDGISYYQVTKYGSKNAKVKFCDGISPEERPVEYWGKESLVTLGYVDVALVEHPAFPQNNKE